MRFTRLIARIFIGSLFFAHGAQKLFGWFGGSGVEETAETMERIGMHPGRRNALAAGANEAFGGAALAVGAFTPAAATAQTAAAGEAADAIATQQEAIAQTLAIVTEEARMRGRRDRARGLKRSAVPMEYRDVTRAGEAEVAAPPAVAQITARPCTRH